MSTLEPMARGLRACRSRLEALKLEAAVGALRSFGARSSRSANAAVNPNPMTKHAERENLGKERV